MCYYLLYEIRTGQKGRIVSALVDFINLRMGQLKKTPSEVADDGGLSRAVLSNIMTKEAKGGKPVRPEPDTIKKLAVGLDVHPSILTAALGYPTEPIQGIDERLYELSVRLLAAPWLAERIDDFLRLPKSDFDELMSHLEFRRLQSAGRSKSSARKKAGCE